MLIKTCGLQIAGTCEVGFRLSLASVKTWPRQSSGLLGSSLQARQLHLIAGTDLAGADQLMGAAQDRGPD